MQEVSNVVVHSSSPGMVTTDLLMSGATNTKQAKYFINVLAGPAEEVAKYLLPSIRSIPSRGSTKPTYIRFLMGLKAYSHIVSICCLCKGENVQVIFTAFIIGYRGLQVVIADSTSFHGQCSYRG